MAAKRISQREARALRRQVMELRALLERQRHHWLQDWPGGVHLRTLALDPPEYEAVRVARALGHAVVLTKADGPNQVRMYALPLVRAGQ